MDLNEAVDELYGRHPDEFMSSRRDLVARAKAAKETGLAKAIESVRKPTAAAWAVNQLVRARPEEMEQLVTLAASLHEAQEKMDGAALKTLSRERSKLVDALVRSCAEVAEEAGGSLSQPVAVQVRDTFVAALATTEAASAVGSGQLTRSLSYAGFGDVDLSEATAAPSPARRPALRVITGDGKGSRPSGKGKAEPAQELEEEPAEPDPELLKRLRAAEKRSRETMQAAATAGDALSEAAEALEDLDARIASLDAELKEARSQRDGLVKAHKEAVAANKVADRTLRAALAEVDQIRAKLPDTDDD